MANGTYGTKKPAFITNDDIDIFYYYRPSRSVESSDFSSFKQLDRRLLNQVTAESDGTSIGVLPGMYDLRLPLDIFGLKGIYTIYIKPREIRTNIVAVSSLAVNSNIRGIVLNTEDFDNGEIGNNGNLIGYRIEYFNNGIREDMYRIITSNNRCEPLSQNLTDSYSSGIRYRFNDSSNLTFCTLTPSSSLSFEPNSTPNIGTPNQEIALINTKFNPIMFEIEMVDHDIDTISTMLEGDQLRNLDSSLITTFDENGGIYHQAMYGTVVDGAKNKHHDYKITRHGLVTDESDTFEDIKDNLE